MELRVLRIISGGQAGADQAGLMVARRFGLLTGGRMPHGFRTLTGARPDLARLYGLTEDASSSYAPRTTANVRDSDGTLRLAGVFESAGERCTLTAIRSLRKPHFDMNLTHWSEADIAAAARWLAIHQIVTLNIAGNSDRTYPGAFTRSAEVLTQLFTAIGLRPVPSA